MHPDSILCDDVVVQRRIVIGYVFAAKKMSTMSVVMAESSKVPLYFSRSTGHICVLPHSFPSSSFQETPESISTNAMPYELEDSCGSSSSRSSRSTLSARDVSSDQEYIPIRVSFVPLDLDIPLEEQHGGKIDVILHKLTEDILCIAQMSSSSTPAIPRSLSPLNASPSPQQLAIRRIQRLMDYHDRMGASLVDHPTAVQTVMSRADMAHTLQSCLQNVQTLSGLSVGAPAFAVMTDPSDESWQRVAFPMMVKPLTAAGTKASHALTVLLNAPDDDRDVRTVQTILQEKVPCLCQEYCNHDGVLYKVYVLGDFISVHARRSLPNIPARRSAYTHLDFDSQCPYPHLADFGYFEEDKAAAAEEKKDDRIPTETDHDVSVEEVRPIVAALKQAFGLQLFGFDILIATTQEPRTLRVVDVNYFPSYKEVTQFPMLLAQYLTQCAQVGRSVKA